MKTAEAIARDIGILLPNDSAECAVDSAMLRPDGEYDPANIDRLSRSAKVFARAQPEVNIVVHLTPTWPLSRPYRVEGKRGRVGSRSKRPASPPRVVKLF